MAAREVVVVSAVRTAVGDYGGALKDIPPAELGALVLKEAIGRAKVDPAQVGHVFFGHVINTEPRDMYLSRVATINSGLPKEVAAATSTGFAAAACRRSSRPRNRSCSAIPTSPSAPVPSR